MTVKAKKDASQHNLAEYKPMLNDIIVPIMGPSGVGKSTFINYLAGKEVARVGHDAQSCTTELEPIVVNPPPSILFRGRRLVLVDTPGFDETFAADSVTLKRIASWLADIYSADTKLGGLIYLHDISLSRMKGTSLRNLEVFKKLCGGRALRSVVLGTTKWTQSKDPLIREARLQELCEKYWKEMIEHGSMVHKFEDTQKSAWEMVDSVLAYDVIIPVIGLSGVGKSLFVNTLAGRHEVTVGEELHSCTSEVQPVIIDPNLASSRKASYHGRRLIVVDTPGFDATYVDDSTTLKLIVDNLTTRCGSDIKLGGIIYLHDVNLRPHSDFHKFLDEIGRLWVEPKALVLGTTKWGDNKGNSDRERKLNSVRERKHNNLTEDYWNKLIDGGAKVCKFTGSQDSAWMMVKAILDDNIETPHRTEVLQIQEELVGAKKLIPDTEAGRHLRHSLDQLLKTLNSKGLTSGEELGPAQIARIRAQIKALHIPLSQRLLRFFAIQKNHLRQLLASKEGTKAKLDCANVILLLGESREGKRELLKLLSAKEPIGERNLSTTGFEPWSVKRGDDCLVLIDTPDIELSTNALHILQKIHVWVETSCTQNTTFGVLCLRDEVVCDKETDFDTDTSVARSCEGAVEESKALVKRTPPLGSFDATHPQEGPTVGFSGTVKLLQQSLAKTTLFATLAPETRRSGIDPDGIPYAFDGKFAAFPTTSSAASDIVDAVLGKTIPLDALLEALPGKVDKQPKDKSPSRHSLRRFFTQESQP